jgi:hypothetical protein
MITFKYPRLMMFVFFSLVSLILTGCNSGPATMAVLTVNTNGSGSVNPGTATVPVGKLLTLTATPASGWRFDHWEGPVTGQNNPITITVTTDVAITAFFVSSSTPRVPEAYNLTATTTIGTPISIPLQGYSPDSPKGTTLTYTTVAPTHGILGGGTPPITYTPAVGYTGPDSFTYTVKDNSNTSPAATVNLTVAQANLNGWARSFGSTDVDRIYAITHDAKGNIYITGKFSGTVDFNPGPENALYASAGKTDAFLAKFSTTGEFKWVKTIGGAENDTGTALATDSLDNVYIVGTFSGTVAVDAKSGTNLTSPSGTGVFVCRFNSDGVFGWARSMAGNGNVQGFAVGLDPVGNMYIGGSFDGQIDFNRIEGKDLITTWGQLDGFVTKLTTEGAYGWTKVYGGVGPDEITAIGAEITGNIYLAGYFALTMNINPGGTTENVIAQGAANAFIVKLNPSGQKIWSKVIIGQGKDQILALAVNDLGFLVVGGVFEQTFQSQTSNGKSDGFVSLYSTDGSNLWTRTFGGTEADMVNGVAIDSNSNVYATGSFTGTVNFRQSFGGFDSKISAGLTDAFAVRILSSGEYGAATTAGGPKADAAYAISYNPMTITLFWAGSFQDTANLDPRYYLGTLVNTNTVEKHVSFGSDDCFLIGMTPDLSW